jgi:hypothetical protein
MGSMPVTVPSMRLPAPVLAIRSADRRLDLPVRFLRLLALRVLVLRGAHA